MHVYPILCSTFLLLTLSIQLLLSILRYIQHSKALIFFRIPRLTLLNAGYIVERYKTGGKEVVVLKL